MKRHNSISKGVMQMLSLFIAFGLCGGAQAQADAQNSITALNVSSTGDGATVIKVELAQPLANAPAGFTINTPPRIALDFPNTANGLGKSAQEFNEGDLRSANIVQAGNRTRLVINLTQMHTLRDVDFRRGKNGEGRIQVDLSDPGIGIDIRQQGTTLIVDFLKTSLPRNSVEDRVARLLDQRREVLPEGVAVGVVRIHAGDDLVGAHLVPHRHEA